MKVTDTPSARNQPQSIENESSREVSVSSVVTEARRKQPYQPVMLSEVRAELHGPLKEMAALSAHSNRVSLSEVEAWKNEKLASAKSPDERQHVESISAQCAEALHTCLSRSRFENTVKTTGMVLTDVATAPFTPFIMIEEALKEEVENERFRAAWYGR